METSSSRIKLNLPTAPSIPSNIDAPGITGAVTPIQMGGSFKRLPSFDVVFSRNHDEASASS